MRARTSSEGIWTLSWVCLKDMIAHGLMKFLHRSLAVGLIRNPVMQDAGSCNLLPLSNSNAWIHQVHMPPFIPHTFPIIAVVSNAGSCSLPSQRISWKRNLTGWPPQRAWESTLKQARMQRARHCSTGRLQRDTIWQTHCRACSPESAC